MKKYFLKVNSVIFDMDGVITNTMPYHYQAWARVLKSHGINVTYLDIYSREGQKGLVSVKELFAKYKKKATLQTAKRILRDKEDCFKKIFKKRFIVGARSFLKSLHKNNFRLALVTGTSRHELLKMLPSHLIQLFAAIVTGCEVKLGKPHPEPYLKSLRLLDVPAKWAVAIENAPYGIQSAKSAGLKTLALETSLPKQHLFMADDTFSSIGDLQSRVQLIYKDQHRC